MEYMISFRLHTLTFEYRLQNPNHCIIGVVLIAFYVFLIMRMILPMAWSVSLNTSIVQILCTDDPYHEGRWISSRQ